MLVLQQPPCDAAGEQGCCAAVFAELQAGPKAPAAHDRAYRWRLESLAQRLARVQALGGEYARVSFSPELEQQVQELSA